MSEDYKELVKNLIRNRNKQKELIIVINNDKPIFKKKDYEMIEGIPQYFEPDKYGRSNGAIAIISKNTIPLTINKKLKYLAPYGWTKEIENKGIFEKCHIIAYSLSAKIVDKRNIFIGTQYLNRSIMSKVENRIKNYIINNNVRILYRVTVKYNEKEQIPTGILIEAQSIDDEFCICQFCYNIQTEVEFKYSNGTIILDNRNTKDKAKRYITKILKVKESKKVIEEDNKYLNYIINRKKNEFHLLDKEYKCKKIKNIEAKYLQETTTKEKELLNMGLASCNNCIKNK